MFPKLLLLMEKNCQDSKDLVSHFHSRMSSVTSWTMLPWCNQLLGMLQSKESVAMMIKPVILQMAEEYPQGKKSQIVVN